MPHTQTETMRMGQQMRKTKTRCQGSMREKREPLLEKEGEDAPGREGGLAEGRGGGRWHGSGGGVSRESILVLMAWGREGMLGWGGTTWSRFA